MLPIPNAQVLVFAVLLVIWTNVDIKPELQDKAFGGLMCGGCTFCFENRKANLLIVLSAEKTTPCFCNTKKIQKNMKVMDVLGTFAIFTDWPLRIVYRLVLWRFSRDKRKLPGCLRLEGSKQQNWI